MEFLPLIILVPLVAFWAWMFRHMTNNDDLPAESTPRFTWPPTSKYAWMWTFIVLNIAGAALYYMTVYREDR